MPYSINGCGTRLYGRRLVGPDGSYVATEWVTLFFLPVFPIRSRRVLPQGKGTNWGVYNSQSYLMQKEPICWPQVRNGYLITAPLLILFLVLDWSEVSRFLKRDVLHIRPTMQVQAYIPEPALSEEQAVVACGSVLKLEAPTFIKLNLHERIGAVVKESDFTAAEYKNAESADDIENDAFGGYALGFVTWNKPVESVRADLDKKMVDQVNKAGADLSGDELAEVHAWGEKYVGMLRKTMDMGRKDARTSPCPY